MNSTKSLWVAVVVVAIIALSGIFFPQVTQTVVEKTLGSVVGPYSPVPQMNFNGLNIVGQRVALQSASSTVCAIKSPTATSTLISAGVSFQLASTSAVTVDLSKSASKYATSTNINSSYGIAASAQATIVASSTGSVAGDATIFSPSDWFVVRFNTWSSSSGAGNAPKGSCWAFFAQP